MPLLTTTAAAQRSKFSSDAASQREEHARLEARLSEERRDRLALEEQLSHLQAEQHSKARDMEGK
jgi:hypothetical protein